MRVLILIVAKQGRPRRGAVYSSASTEAMRGVRTPPTSVLAVRGRPVGRVSVRQRGPVRLRRPVRHPCPRGLPAESGRAAHWRGAGACWPCGTERPRPVPHRSLGCGTTDPCIEAPLGDASRRADRFCSRDRGQPVRRGLPRGHRRSGCWIGARRGVTAARQPRTSRPSTAAEAPPAAAARSPCCEQTQIVL